MLSKSKRGCIKEHISLAKAELDMMMLEHEEIILQGQKKRSKKSKKSSVSGEYEDLFMRSTASELYRIRGNRKHASLTIELYSIFEQLLSDIFRVCSGKNKREMGVDELIS